MLSNTYHLHLRPVTKTSKPSEDFTNSPDGTAPFSPTAADFRFSLAKLRHITEGVEFNSHIDGHKIFMGPEESINQSNLGSTIAMAFDECVENPAKYEYAKKSSEKEPSGGLRGARRK